MKKRIFKKKFKKVLSQLLTDGVAFGQSYAEVTNKGVRRLHPIKDSKIIESRLKDKKLIKIEL